MSILALWALWKKNSACGPDEGRLLHRGAMNPPVLMPRGRGDRVSREIGLSSQDHGLSAVDNLSRCLASCTPDSEDGHPSQRRRLAGYCKVTTADWDSLSTIDNPDAESEKNTTEGLGLLSLDENSEVRWHGQLSGLHLLGRNKGKMTAWKAVLGDYLWPSHFTRNPILYGIPVTSNYLLKSCKTTL